MQIISEGKAKIYTGEGVFYNTQMKNLRDISVLFVRAISAKDKRVLDSTAATGIRAIRYALEAGAKDVTLLDVNKTAAALAKKNVKLNKLKMKVFPESIQKFANKEKSSFGIIDHDPFGSPAPSIFDLMKISWDGTVMMITATDTAVLCGAHTKACIKIYGAKPLHNEMCKEVGIRILLSYTARMASQFNFAVTPLLSLEDLHYMRIIVRLDYGADKAVESVKTSGIGTFCKKCYDFKFAHGPAPAISPICNKCGEIVEPFGPLWLGSLHDKETIGKMLKLNKDEKIEKKLELLRNELDVPLFYSVPRMLKHLGRPSVSNYAVMDKLRKTGAKVTMTQFDQNAFKTDAPSQKVLDVVKLVAKRVKE